MSAAHTEGPWRLDDPQHAAVLSERFHIIDSGPGYFAGSYGFSLGGIMSPADARLIASAPAMAARIRQLEEALEHIVRRLQMDIDDGSRPDQWSMEDLVRKANSALKEQS